MKYNPIVEELQKARAEIERLQGECLEQARLLEMSGEHDYANENARLTEQLRLCQIDNNLSEAENVRLRALVEELANDLESEVEGHYAGVKDHPAMRSRYERDMDTVWRARRELEDRKCSE